MQFLFSLNFNFFLILVVLEFEKSKIINGCMLGVFPVFILLLYFFLFLTSIIETILVYDVYHVFF